MTTKWRVYRIASLPERWVPDGYHMRSVRPDEFQEHSEYDTREEAVDWAEYLRNREGGSYAIIEVVA